MSKEPDELRKAIAATMMDGWLESVQDGALHIDGGESTITKTYVNPTVLDKLVALFAAQRQALRDEILKKLEELHEDTVTTKYGYNSDEKKFGFRIGITEAKLAIIFEDKES